jgi:hypothetical protein
MVLAGDHDWMVYIDAELRAVCEAKGWRHQIRRKESVREKPVGKSTVDDYEWKLVPTVQEKLPDTRPEDWQGTYYVLSFDRANRSFLLQHDTSHCGMMGPHWERETHTTIRWNPFTLRLSREARTRPAPAFPPAGWLRNHLEELITRFDPNSFSAT